jgi:hypothetical protein
MASGMGQRAKVQERWSSGVADHVAKDERMALCGRCPEGRRTTEKDGVRRRKTIALSILSIHTTFSLPNHVSEYFNDCSVPWQVTLFL